MIQDVDVDAEGDKLICLKGLSELLGGALDKVDLLDIKEILKSGKVSVRKLSISSQSQVLQPICSWNLSNGPPASDA